MGFGIAGAAFAVGAFLTPIGFNLVASWIALTCAALAVPSKRGTVLAVVTWIVCAINLFLLNSETRMALLGWPSNGAASPLVATLALYLTIASFGAPVLTAIFSGAWSRRSAKKNEAVPAPASPLALAPDVELDRLPIESAPVRGGPEVPPPRLRSKTARLLLLLATVIGAAAVAIFLRSLDVPLSAPGHGTTGNSTAATAI